MQVQALVLVLVLVLVQVLVQAQAQARLQALVQVQVRAIGRPGRPGVSGSARPPKRGAMRVAERTGPTLRAPARASATPSRPW